MKNKTMKLIRIFAPIIIGTLIGFLIKNNLNGNLYQKPPFYPPQILFPIAWSLIYLLMGIAYFLYRNKSNDKETNLSYYQNLILNFGWPILFFIFKLYFVSIFWIILLDISTILLMKKYYSSNKISAYLLIPYLLWLSWATYLNIALVILN